MVQVKSGRCLGVDHEVVVLIMNTIPSGSQRDVNYAVGIRLVLHMNVCVVGSGHVEIVGGADYTDRRGNIQYVTDIWLRK